MLRTFKILAIIHVIEGRWWLSTVGCALIGMQLHGYYLLACHAVNIRIIFELDLFSRRSKIASLDAVHMC